MAISDYLKDLRSKVGHQLLHIPSVAAIIRDEKNRILLQKTSEDFWSLPAGAIELGETPAQAVIREVWEETNLIVRPRRVAGVFGGENGFRFKYKNGDRVEYVVILFECETVGGELGGRHDETFELDYFPPEKMPKLPINYPHELFLHSADKTYFEWNEKWLEELK
jgi:8-oxo-dGTP pyrophosphatase MutT (NUDIX family)